MKTIISSLILALVLLFAPIVLAQHSGHGTGHGGSGATHSSGTTHTTGVLHGGRQNGSQRHYEGYNRSHTDVYNGRFRHDVEVEHFGREHRYYGRDFHWYGRPYGYGSRFFIGGYWFGINGPWPAYWGDSCGYYVDYDVAVGGYFAYCPEYPGVRVSVVVF